MNTKKTTILFLLTACVRQIYLDIPLTENEKVFFTQVQDNSLYPIDSIGRVITDDLAGDWLIHKVKHIHIHIYLDMLKKILIGICVIFVSSCRCQNMVTTAPKETCHYYYDTTLKINIYDMVDVYPEYNGGINKFLKYITDSLSISQIDTLISKIVVSVIIDKNGVPISYSINNKQRTEYFGIEKEIDNKLKAMELWIPAKCKDVEVASIIKIPINIHFK